MYALFGIIFHIIGGIAAGSFYVPYKKVKCFTALEDRIFSHLSMTAEERYNLFFTQNNALFNQVPSKYIASMLGMTPETLSRIRKKAAL